MSRILSILRLHAAMQPRRPAMQDAASTLDYAALLEVVEQLASRLRAMAPRAVALLADNSCDWAVCDLALHIARIPALPLPLYFTARQIDHAIAAAGIDLVITDHAPRLDREIASSTAFHGRLRCLALKGVRPVTLPLGTTKITFTSGTTGEPKGVCLGRAQIEAVAESLCVASQAVAGDRHLCLLPLPTLLENIAGIFTPLLAGACVCVPGLAEVGMSGSSGLDIGRLVGALGTWQASTVITVPQTLQAIVSAAQAGARLPGSLRYVAVGGAPVALELLGSARAVGVPVYEGFGLSECASVVAVNGPGDHRPGSVGRPLPHVRIDFADDGEILVRDVPWRGYLGLPPVGTAAEPGFATGDLGHLDADGYLYVTGRKKNIFITSFGRNVAPEWVERELVSRAPVIQAAVFGESRPFNVAVLFARPGDSNDAIDRVVATANRLLPDYARVAAWIAADEPFTPANGMLTFNGRPRRDRIRATYADRIDAQYSALSTPVTTP